MQPLTIPYTGQRFLISTFIAAGYDVLGIWFGKLQLNREHNYNEDRIAKLVGIGSSGSIEREVSWDFPPAKISS